LAVYCCGIPNGRGCRDQIAESRCKIPKIAGNSFREKGFEIVSGPLSWPVRATMTDMLGQHIDHIAVLADGETSEQRRQKADWHLCGADWRAYACAHEQ